MSDKTRVPLSDMVGGGTNFLAQGKKYRVLPLKLCEIDKFIESNIVIGEGQFFNVSGEAQKKNIDFWIKKKVLAEDGSEFSLEGAYADEWDLDDLGEMIRSLMRLSG